MTNSDAFSASALQAARRQPLQKEAEARGLTGTEGDADLARYRTDPVGYARDVLGLTPWAGRNAKGQLELFQDIGESVRMQLAGETRPDGAPPPKIFRVEAGHGVGKTYGAAMLVNWFFDCFAPSITMTTAPSKEQVENLLWKDIKKIRPPGLTGRVLPNSPRMEKAPDHFAIGRTTSDGGGKGTERFQGQHDEFLFFLLDEAEGVPAFVFDAVNAMMTGGRVILCLMLANPRTRASRFYKTGQRAGVMNYRLSVLDHPNALDGADTVPGATGRAWVEQCLDDWCEVVPEHSEDDHTFAVPWRPGVIFKPNAEFLFRVMGVPPANIADNTLITVGRLEAACKRVLTPLPVDQKGEDGEGEGEDGDDANDEEDENEELGEEEDADDGRDLPPEKQVWGYLGCDVAGFGKDCGTLYRRLHDVIRRSSQLWKQDYDDYARRIKQEALKMKAEGATHLSLRIDAGGGFGQGVLSHLKKDQEFLAAFPGRRLVIHKVDFGTPARDGRAYDNVVTELYAHAAETLKGVRVEKAPETLEPDLCERTYDWVNRSGVEVKKLEEKKAFKKRHSGRSPDDGDGFVLCAAPEFLFGKRKIKVY